ncbi:MAG: hypothetical protein PHP59_08460 [Methanofollis sp.]|uniref:hypothetical protein n=1 Tax=Methanofollis sp. TaxID=2052835 RepID=UPI00260E070E|nr:hypothetical protein [Methanofollis sp.]MDD4255392.1 hypothetical protein [Methanofollis sp.]
MSRWSSRACAISGTESFPSFFLPDDFGNLVIDGSTNTDLVRKALSSEPAGYQVRASKSFCTKCGSEVGAGDTFCHW